MNPSLPPALKAGIEALLDGVSRNQLALRAAAISRVYRAGGGSAATITDEVSVLAYVASRLPATYAVAAAVFNAIKEAAPGFAPKSLLDAGAGPGTASWAAVQTWGEIANITMADSNRAFLDVAKTLASGSPWPGATEIVSFNLHDGAPPQADLVTANFVLAEVDEPEQKAFVDRLWTSAIAILVLIEPGTPAGFSRIRAARDFLIAKGAHVLAPCTHDHPCPMSGTDWCHFSQRLSRSRDHLKVKGASVPFEDEPYSYVAVSRAPIERANLARIVAPPQDSKAGITLPLCTDRGLQNAFVAKRRRDLYGLLRKAKWGDTILSEE